MMGQLNNRLLLVDDDELSRKLTARHLIAAGYVVRTAEDGLDAIAKLRAGLPDLIISDLNMPAMSGFEFLGVVRKRFPQIPVIAVSGLTKDEIPQGLDPDAYFHKNGLGFQPLLETILVLRGKPPRRTGLPNANNEPALAKWDGDGRYFIQCGDCFREFNVPRVLHMGRSEKWATCIHCGKFGQFLLAEHPKGK